MSHRLWALALCALVATGRPGAALAQTTVSGTVHNGGRGMPDAAVYLVPLGDTTPVEAGPATTIDQIHLSFSPRTLVIAPGTEVSFLNSDQVLHNVFGPGLGGMDAFDLGTYPQGAHRSYAFEQAGLHIVLCHIHPEMAAYVIVAPTRHSALTAVDGSFDLVDVRPGRYRLHAWHPRHWRREYTEDVVIPSGGLTDVSITLGRSGSRTER